MRQIKKPGPLRRLIRKIGTLNMILVMVGAFFVWFNWQMIELYRQFGSMPETYACAVIAATIGECGICGWIRTTKDKQREKSMEKVSRDDENSFEKTERGGEKWGGENDVGRR